MLASALSTLPPLIRSAFTALALAEIDNHCTETVWANSVMDDVADAVLDADTYDGEEASRADTTPTAFLDGEVSDLDDGSPSTVGVRGRYTGSWDLAASHPHGNLDACSSSPRVLSVCSVCSNKVAGLPCNSCVVMCVCMRVCVFDVCGVCRSW